MSAHLQMSSQWFMGKMGEGGGEVMSGSWHSRALVYVFVLSKNTPIIFPSLLLNLLKVYLQTISGNDRPGSARKHIRNSLHWSKSRMSRCTAKVGAVDTTYTRSGTHSDQLLLSVWLGKSLLWSESWSHHLRIGTCVLRLPPMVWESVPGSLVVCFALIMTLCCYCKMANAHPRENVQTILH